MVKLTEYIHWIGDLDFHAYPFREADALILCVICYYDLSPVFSEEKESVSVADCLPMIEAGEAKIMITGGDMGNGEIFEAAARSKRFGQLKMTDYDDRSRAEPPLQFSAVTFRSNDFSFIAYRGTDDSIAGWKENCMISFTLTEAQELSSKYANKQIHSGKWYIAGHSKGANQALYASCMLSDKKWEHVEHVFLLDGPGFCPDVLDQSLIKRIDSKATRIIPKYDVVGKLFEPEITDTKIVNSYRDGILQHSLASWMIEHGDLSLTESNDPESVWINHLMNDWIEGIPHEEREKLVDELFNSITADGITSLEELNLDEMETILIKMSGTSEETKKTFAQLPGKVIFDDAIPEVPPEKSKHILSVISDLRVHGLVLLILGVAGFFVSEKVLEFSSLALVTLLAVIQLAVTVRRLVKQHGNMEGMRQRLMILITVIAMAVILYFKEQAMFLIGSLIFGILLLGFGSYSIESGIKRSDDIFLKVLSFVEGGISILYGAGFLLIPRSVVHPFMGSLTLNVALDGLIRIVYWFVRHIKIKRNV